jgi:hypothetical protein
MKIARATPAAVLGLRISYGVALVLAPRRLARGWLGPAADGAPVQVALRGLGVREAILHTGALLALTRGAPLRPWFAASIVGDVSDVISTAVERRRLPQGSSSATLAVGGAAALASLAVAVAVER